jgi:choline dehydrogenase
LFSYLSTEHDLAVLERGMAILTRIMRTAPLSDIIDHTATDKRLGTWLPTANPAELREYVRKYVETFYHPTSTARMAPLSDGGVVDAQLRVHGVRGLRVVDASIFPTIVSGHTVCGSASFIMLIAELVTAVDFDTQAGPTIAVAEKASDLILQDLALRNSI